jgi:outer membrane lipoprotein carrier protein
VSVKSLLRHRRRAATSVGCALALVSVGLATTRSGEAASTPQSAPAAPVATAAPVAAATAAPAPVPSAAAAADVEKILAGLSSWSADFNQTIDDGHGKILRAAAGHLSLQRPGKFRWDYTEPSEQLVLADGKHLWFYDKDLAQANIRDMDASLSSTPAVLLSGGAPLTSQFSIAALPPADGLEWFQLLPTHPDTDFQAVRIGFKSGELEQLLLADKLDEVTRLRFSHQQRNAKFAPGLFSFTPPPGVDVIGRTDR